MSAVESTLAASGDLARLGVVQSQPMTYQEFLNWEPEGGLTEWIDGEGVQYMAASEIHQNLIGFLLALLRFFVDANKLGKVYTGPYTMRAKPDGNAREPDIFVVLRDNPGRLAEKALEGAADIVIEVVSDDSVYRDRVEKFDEYEAAGVREYWLIDPRPNRKRADFFLLDATGRYQSVPVGAENIFRSSVLPGFWLKVDWLWTEDANVVEIYQAITLPA
jgi:Uma2 family endonuclease